MSTLKVGEIKHESFTGTTQLKLDSAGNVLIGTTSANKRLTLIDRTDPIAMIIGENDNATTEAGLRIQARNTGNTSGFNLDIAVDADASAATFDFGGSERMRIDSSGNIGIGTSSPSTKLHLFGEASDFEGLRLTNNLRNDSAASSAQIKFDIRNSGGLRTARIEAREKDTNNNECELNFYTNSSASQNGEVERMTISGTGNVGIGTSSPAKKLHVFESGEARIRIETGDSRGQAFDLLSTNGAPSNTGTLSIRNESNQSFIDFSHNGGSPFTKIYNTGSQQFTFDSDGLKFGSDTAAANALDDYEEGTFTPVYNYSGRSFNYYLQTGSYVKIGKTVHFILGIGTSSTSGSGTSGPVKIDGLPFASNARSAVAIRATNFASDPARTATVESGATFMELIKQTSSGTADMTGSSLSTSNFGNIVYAAGHYETNS